MGVECGDYGAAVGEAIGRAQVRFGLPLSEASAAQLADWLWGLSRAHQRLVLHNLPAARRPEVLQRLLKETDQQVWGAPERLLRLARAAVAVGEALDPRCHASLFVHDRRAEAWCRLANARRVLGRHGAAEAAFGRAWEEARAGSGDPVLVGDLLCFQSSLRAEQRRFEEAVALTKAGASAYRSVGEECLEIKALVVQTATYAQGGQWARAIEQSYTIACRLDPSRETHLARCCLSNAVYCYQKAKLPHQALTLFEAIEPLFASAGEVGAVRRRWIKGSLLTSLGQVAEGGEMLEEVRLALLEHRMAYNAALAGLELARVWAVRGNRKRVRELAAEVLPVFVSLGIRREAGQAARWLAWAG